MDEEHDNKEDVAKIAVTALAIGAIAAYVATYPERKRKRTLKKDALRKMKLIRNYEERVHYFCTDDNIPPEELTERWHDETMFMQIICNQPINPPRKESP